MQWPSTILCSWVYLAFLANGSSSGSQAPFEPMHHQLSCEGIRAELGLHDLTRSSFAGLAVKRRARGPAEPQPLAFPPAARIVDPAVEPFGEKPDRVGNAKRDPLTVDDGHQSV